MKKILLLALLVLLALLCGCSVDLVKQSRVTEYDTSELTTEETEVSTDGSETQAAGVVQSESVPSESESASEEEPVIYTFLQGQKSYEQEILWSGAWCDYEEGGKVFGHFGCSLCCMANIYDTMSPYQCSPLDFLTFTKEATSYDPSGGSAALGWMEMRLAMESAGIACELYNKDDSFDIFAQMIKDNRTAIVLVCSSNDDTIWKNESGHYVNIWDYDEETGEVFLADPASPSRNRTQVSLQHIYDALKTTSSYQYLLVTAYDESADSFRKNGIDEDWISGLR